MFQNEIVKQVIVFLNIIVAVIVGNFLWDKYQSQKMSNNPSPPTQQVVSTSHNYNDNLKAIDPFTPIYVDNEPLQAIHDQQPQTGYTERYTTQQPLAPLTIHAPRQYSVLVKLVERNLQQPVLTMFVRAGETAKTSVPLGEFSLKYAMGNDWQGYDKLFGMMTIYKEADKILSFTQDEQGTNGHEITLHAKIDGNMTSDFINANHF